MSNTARILQLIGTFLPVYGVVLTVLLAITLKGRWRVVSLLFVPLLTYFLCSYFGSDIAYDGNMLYVIQVAVFVAVLPIYYPVLLVIGGIRWVRMKRGEN